MESKKAALGRGLGNLLGNIDAELSAVAPDKKQLESSVLFVAIENIFPAENQPRKTFNETSLAGLAESIKENGILQPVILRLKNKSDSQLKSDQYEIIAGERRWRAAQLAGLSKIPAIVKSSVDEQTVRKWALLENIQREDLNPLEEARAFQDILDHYSIEKNDLAKALGVDRSSLTNKLRILTLPESVQKVVASGSVSLGHAKVLLGLDEAYDQIELSQQVVNAGLSVRALEKKVLDIKKQKTSSQENKSKASFLIAVKALEKEIESVIGAPAQITVNQKGKGKLVLTLNSHEALNEMVLNIKKGWGRNYGV